MFAHIETALAHAGKGQFHTACQGTESRSHEVRDPALFTSLALVLESAALYVATILRAVVLKASVERRCTENARTYQKARHSARNTQ